MPLQETSGAASYDAFGGGALAVAPLAEAIDFDGTNDFLRRTSDLIGNTNGKIVTISFWVWIPTGASQGIIYAGGYGGTYYGLNINFNGGYININGARETFGSGIFSWSTPLLPFNTWLHVVLSFDLSNTSLRSSYINDVQSGSFGSYSNFNLFLAQATHYVGRQDAPAYYARARISNLFIDYTYRDLTNVTNRRLFVTADLKPAANQQALNPILYLPMSDPTQPGLNQGTGGNFTLTGTVARSGRGPNQYNAPYSDLDGSADYLERSSSLGSPNFPNVITFDCTFNSDSISTTQHIFSNGSSRNIWIYLDSSKINIAFHNGSSEFARFTQTNSLVSNRNYTLTFSVDFRSSSTRTVYLNGEPLSGTWSSYSNSDVPFTNTPYRVGVRSDSLTGYFNGRIGRVYLSASSNTGYIDLSVPANLAKFVSGTGINAAPVDLGATGQLPTGTSPQLYLPMYGNDAGKNYGTGGDFTVNSGPFNGARGPNEWWGNWRDVFAGAGNYIRRTTGLIGATNVNTFTCSAWFYANTAGAYQLFFIAGTVNGYDRVAVSMDNGRLKVRVANSTDTGYVLAWQSSSSSLITTGFIYNVLVSRSGTTIQAFLNGVSVPGTASPSGSGEMTIVDRPVYIGASNDSSGSSGSFWVGEVYFNTHYTDFSQEANRLLFRDAFNTPTNLPSLILNGSVPNPLVYLRTGPSDPGENSGTGGAFTSTLNVDRGQF
jgi:hypothetical protein